MKIPCIILLILVSFSVGCVSHGTDSGSVPDKTEPKVSTISDSLSILDTLVQVTRISNSRLSLTYAKRALTLAKLSGKPEDLVLANIIIGTSFNTNDKDSSYYYFNMALRSANKPALLKLKSRILYNLAMFYNAAYDYKTCVQFLDTTIRLSDSIKDYAMMADAYNALGATRYSLQDTNAAQEILKKHIDQATS